MWEIPALAIMNELRSRQATKGQGRFVLDVLYARAKAKLWSKVERLRKLEGLRLSISAPAAATAFSGSAGASRRQGGPRASVHRHVQRAARDGQRSRSDRHQRA
jgi:hypothetical protein